MRSAFHHTEPRYPTDWTELPAGEVIQQAVQEVCNSYSQRIFGYHFVKLGNLSAQIQLARCPVSHQINQTRVLGDQTGLQGKSHELPYIENSIDGFLLANELDFAQDPHQILREVDRCITHSGYVMISGFNPFSLTGIGKFLPINRGNILHDARFFTSSRIRDWLQLLGFEIVEQRQVLFSMLFFKYRKKELSAFQQWLCKYCPWCSSVYVILARKRVWPMTTVRPKWKLQPQFSPLGASMRLKAGEAIHKKEQ
ncbi:methyltransferase domain-containing protein [Alteromonas pelagimontana]|uniref:Methyltransferase domain-containing protein n=1 Tax=Alteromonas pelagimontana TaxID=1858656 RepID=A0A6M4MI37_9ALTE|nr:methyltransferase domain-containing protein [Alteromonas pelagimontana]QJR82260.1 methyltransferase domain-containing protein [Alteromonas pelagimontana]